MTRNTHDHSHAVEHLIQADPILARLIRQVGPCNLRIRSRRTPYQALVSAVIYQQLNGIAAETILSRVQSLYSKTRFPSPEQLLESPDEELRAAGLSRAKTAALKDIAAKTLSGLVPSTRVIRKLSDAEIMERLVQLRGVGPWTVEMLLIFTLGRLDILPVTDYGVQKGFALTYSWDDIPQPRQLLAEGERWRPFRSIAAWYFWRAVELPRH
ncbi:MAG TPA: DNA-3-methyladenine glycosylase [Clostridia bacterium]|nr:DNA-3-methyladenine glycosylase [Clostridia bacterium]